MVKGKNRKRRYSAQKRATLLEGFRNAANKREYAKTAGVHLSTLHTWAARARRDDGKGTPIRKPEREIPKRKTKGPAGVVTSIKRNTVTVVPFAKLPPVFCLNMAIIALESAGDTLTYEEACGLALSALKRE